MRITLWPSARLLWLGSLLLPLLFLGFYLPLYGDEIHWKWKTARWFLDGRFALDVFPQCLTSFFKYPRWWFPARALDALLYEDLSRLIKLRVLGFVNFFVWLALFWSLCHRLNSENKPLGTDIFLFSVSLLLLGVLPLGLFINRPEQPLLIYLTGFILLGLFEAKTVIKQSILTVIGAILINLFFAQHAKALFFIPLFIACIAYMAISRKQKVFLFCFLILSSWTCFKFFSEITACPENPHIRDLFLGQAVSPSQFLTEPMQTLKQMVGNLLSSRIYLNHILFWEHFMAYWLPDLPSSMSLVEINLNRLIRSLIWGLVIVLIVSIPLFWLKPDLVSKKRRSVLTALFLSLCGVSAFQNTKAFYESALIIPCLVLTVPFVVAKLEGRLWFRNLLTLGSVATLMVSTTSVIRLTTHLIPFVNSQWKTGELLSHPFSTSPFNLDSIRNSIEEVNQDCQFQPEKEKHLVLDDQTYPFFSSSALPFHIFYLTNLPHGLEAFLRNRQSTGIISQCRFLKDGLLNRAFKSKNGHICCVRFS